MLEVAAARVTAYPQLVTSRGSEGESKSCFLLLIAPIIILVFKRFFSQLSEAFCVSGISGEDSSICIFRGYSATIRIILF